MYSPQEINRAFSILVKDIEKHKNKPTSCDDVLQLLYDSTETVWWPSWEIVSKPTSTGGWVSHRGPARASDLVNKESEYRDGKPLLVEKKHGRYSLYRLNYDAMQQIEDRLNCKKQLNKAVIQPVYKYQYDAARGCMVEVLVNK